MAHAALPALLATPPKWKMLPLLPTPCAAAILGLPKPSSRADPDDRLDARKKAASLASSSSSSSSGTSPLISNTCTVSRASSAERWDVHKKRHLPQVKAVDDGSSSSTGSNDDIDTEKILWKPRVMSAGPGFVVAAPESSMVPMPTAFLVRVA